MGFTGCVCALGGNVEQGFTLCTVVANAILMQTHMDAENRHFELSMFMEKKLFGRFPETSSAIL